MNTVSERIQEMLFELKAEGYTQVKIAESLGITQGAVSAYSRGDSQISLPVALLFESNFNYRKEWILEGILPKKVDQKEILQEVSRIAKQGRDIDKIPEIRDLIPKILKLKKEDYDMLVEVIKKFLK